MDNYFAAQTKLNGRQRRKLENHTYLEVRFDGSIAVKLHATDVVTYYPDRTMLNSGGWRTITTKDRLNKYSPVNIWSECGVWYLKNPEGAKGNMGDKLVYEDGLTIYGNGAIQGAGKPNPNVNKAKRRIAAYAKGYAKALAEGKVEAPGPGDCFYCQMDGMHGAEHLESHIDESYYVPRLAYRALEAFGGSVCAKDTLYSLTHGSKLRHGYWDGIGLKQIEKAIKRYVQRQLGYQA